MADPYKPISQCERFNNRGIQGVEDELPSFILFTGFVEGNFVNQACLEEETFVEVGDRARMFATSQEMREALAAGEVRIV